MGRSKQLATIIESAPSTLDTLNELASALGDDANFSTTVTNSIATKLPLAGGTITGNLGITGVTTSTGFSGKIHPVNGTTTNYLSLKDGNELNFYNSSDQSQTLHINYDGGTVDLAGSSVEIAHGGGAIFKKIVQIQGDTETTNLRLRGRSSDQNFYTLYQSHNGAATNASFGTDASNDTFNYQVQNHAFQNLASNNTYMYIKSDGNIGIGTTSPGSRKLRIVGSSSAYPLSLDSTDTDYALEFQKNGTSEWWLKASASSFKIHENGSADHFTVASGGSVGIGTGSTALTAGKVNVELTGVAISGNTDGATMGASSIINLYNNNQVTDSTVMLLGTTSLGVLGQIGSGIGFARENGSNWGTQLRFYTHETNTVDVDALTERMRIDAEGNVTKPYHPSFGCVGFSAHRYMNTWHAVDLHSWNFVYQRNTSHYNNTNGRFTAPVAGMYHFYYHSMFTNPSTNDFHNRLKVNGVAITYSNEHSGGGSSNGHQWNGCSVSMTVNLNAGDYVTADSVGNSSSTLYLYGSGTGSRYSSWGGYLLG